MRSAGRPTTTGTRPSTCSTSARWATGRTRRPTSRWPGRSPTGSSCANAAQATPSRPCSSAPRGCSTSTATTSTRSNCGATSNTSPQNTASSPCPPRRGSSVRSARPTTPSCGWPRPPSSSRRTNSSWRAPWPAARRTTYATSSASKPRPTGARTTFPELRATKAPSASAPSRPTSSASTWWPCCSSPTAATRATNGCATTPSRCSNVFRPRTTATSAPGGMPASRCATPSNRRRCSSSPPNTATPAAVPNPRRPAHRAGRPPGPGGVIHPAGAGQPAGIRPSHTRHTRKPPGEQANPSRNILPFRGKSLLL